jgi:hypothetical protein
VDGRARGPWQEMVNTMDAERRARRLLGLGSRTDLVVLLHDVQPVHRYSVDFQGKIADEPVLCSATNLHKSCTQDRLTYKLLINNEKKLA